MSPSRIASDCCRLSRTSTVYTAPLRNTVSAAWVTAARATGTADNSSAVARIHSDRIEGRPQIGDEIAGIFDANGNSDQSVRNAEAIARRLGNAGVRRAC